MDAHKKTDGSADQTEPTTPKRGKDAGSNTSTKQPQELTHRKKKLYIDTENLHTNLHNNNPNNNTSNNTTVNNNSNNDARNTRGNFHVPLSPFSQMVISELNDKNRNALVSPFTKQLQQSDEDDDDAEADNYMNELRGRGTTTTTNNNNNNTNNNNNNSNNNSSTDTQQQQDKSKKKRSLSPFSLMLRYSFGDLMQHFSEDEGNNSNNDNNNNNNELPTAAISPKSKLIDTRRSMSWDDSTLIRSYSDGDLVSGEIISKLRTSRRDHENDNDGDTAGPVGAHNNNNSNSSNNNSNEQISISNHAMDSGLNSSLLDDHSSSGSDVSSADNSPMVPLRKSSGTSGTEVAPSTPPRLGSIPTTPKGFLNGTGSAINSHNNSLRNNNSNNNSPADATSDMVEAPSEESRSKISEKDPGFFSSLVTNMVQEVTSPYYEPEQELVGKREAVYNFIQVPFHLERLLFFGCMLCLDSFLFVFTFMPLRIIFALFNLFVVLFTKKRLTSTQVWDLSRAVIVLICWYMLSYIDASILYHYIRGQAILKLYVIFNVLEIFDKLCCSIGQDIFASLFWKTVDKNPANAPQKQHLHLHPFTIFCVAIIYTFIHSLVLFHQAVTLNVAINSHNNALLTLLISNQFVELKGSVFKKFEKENLFQISCSDTVERFQIFVFIFIVTLQNFSALDWELDMYWIVFMAQSIGLIMISECLVDWIKHAFIIKFNHISPDVYTQFKFMLTYDFASKQSSYIDTHVVSRRIGFVPLPLACLVLRVCFQMIPNDFLTSVTGIATCVAVFVLLCLLRALIRRRVVQKTNAYRSAHKVPDRFSMFKGKIP